MSYTIGAGPSANVSKGVATVGGDTVSILGTVNGVSTLTRPSDTNGYVAGDEVSDSTAAASAHPWVFAGAARSNGGSGYITKVKLGLSDKLCTSTVFRLYLFKTAPTQVGDNAAYNYLKSEFDSRVAEIDIGPLHTGTGAGSDGASIDVDARKAFHCAANDTALYGLLLVQGSYTPLNAGTIQLSLTVERN